MKINLRILSVAVLLACGTVSAQEPDLKPGLVGQYYRQKQEYKNDSEQPYLVRVDPQINFRSTDGNFYDSKLFQDFGVQWSGQIKIEMPGQYEFELQSDDGSRVLIGEQMIADNSGNHDMRLRKSGSIELQAGLHPIRVDYHQAGGGAGIILRWKSPGADKFEPVPAQNLMHRDADRSGIAWDEATWQNDRFDSKEWRKTYGRPFEKMDYGPFLSHTIKISDDNIVNKGIVINVGNEQNEAFVLFDTELLRYAAGWTGGFIKMNGVAFDGAHGPNPTPDGEVRFRTSSAPGIGNGQLLTDKRARPFGPLNEARYVGLRRTVAGTVVTYKVGDCVVSELPSVTAVEGSYAFTRRLELNRADHPLTITAAEGDGWRVSVAGTPQAEIAHVDGKTTVTFPSSAENARVYAVRITPEDQPEPDADLNAILSEPQSQAAPQLWPETVTTTGVLGTGDGPYVVDTLTIPFDNPYNAWMRIGGVDFFSDGRAAICTWSGDVWIVSGIDERLEKLTWKRYAAGLFQTLGLRIVDDKVYVLGRDQITRLHDLNGDNEADFYENFNNDCEVTPSFHEFTLDLQSDSKGNFYYAKGGPVRPGGRGWETIAAHSGTILRVSPDGKKLDVFATGVRAPNGMSVGPGDVVTVGDNEGTWTPSSRLNIVEAGDFVGVPDLSHRDPEPTTYKPVLAWIPHRDVDNSSGGQVWVTSDNRWGAFEGDMLHMSYGKCSLFKILKEQVNGVWQGGLVRFPLEFESGICRARFNKVDGQLYVAGLRGWQTNAAKDGALQRVRYTGTTVNMPTEMNVHENGITITFTSPVDKETAGDPESYGAERWNYLWTDDYGSPEVSVEDQTQRKRDEVAIDSATVSEDGKSVFLSIPDMKPCMQMKLQMDIDAADGTTMEYAIHHTINELGPRK